jgi:hypothetical protein
MSRANAAEVSGSRGPTSEVVYIGRGALSSMIHERLVKAMGDRRAGEVFRETFDRFGDNDIETPQDLLDFSELLIRSGGLIQAVGRSLKVQALLRGAMER